ncbi:ROK family transcriptional regulator [Natronospirillum operosum]|nr:ROK family transcriptional regulator [Natronospirillum operosum]
MASRPLKGSNLTTVRGINERLILHLLRVHQRLTKAEATRITGLSANAVSVLFRSLESDGLLLRDEPIRGRIGQPSVPMRLNPDALHYVGMKIGRRSFDLVVVNFTGQVKAVISRQHAYPTPATTLQFINEHLDAVVQEAGLARDDISAFNIATPFELWSWTSDFGAPREEMALWKSFDLAGEISRAVPWPVTISNDGTAACRAELVFGPPVDVQDLAYFFIGSFIGGGIVLNGSVFPGRRGNAGGVGPLRIPDESGGDRLVDHASLVVLERLLAQRDTDLAQSIYTETEHWEQFESELTIWVNRAGRSLGHAIVSALAILEFETVVIDGAFPPAVRQRLVSAIEQQLDRLDLQGVNRPELRAGHFGALARAIGAAAYQISTDYMIDQNTLLRETPAKVPLASAPSP